MSDFPTQLQYAPPPGAVMVSSVNSLIQDACQIAATSFTAGGVWPAANRAIYVPFMVDQVVTAYQMAFEVITQSGNCDVGIYDVAGNRLVSKGSTAVAAAGFQSIDITDTVLAPGVYFMAMNVDNTTASFTRSSAVSAVYQQVCGMQQQAVGAVTLPDPATFANPASAYIPMFGVALKSTI